MFNPEKLISPNEELVIVGRHHSGRTIAAAIVLGNFIKSKKEVADKSLILLLVEYAGDAGFWTFLAKELGLIEKISQSLATDSKKLCLDYLANKGYQVEILEHIGKLESSDFVFDKLPLFNERIILIDNANHKLSFDFDNTKVIQTDLYDDRYHDYWSRISTRYPNAKTIVQTRTEHVPNGGSSILFNFLRGEAELLALTLTYEI